MASDDRFDVRSAIDDGTDDVRVWLVERTDSDDEPGTVGDPAERDRYANEASRMAD